MRSRSLCFQGFGEKVSPHSVDRVIRRARKSPDKRRARITRSGVRKPNLWIWMKGTLLAGGAA